MTTKDFFGQKYFKTVDVTDPCYDRDSVGRLNNLDMVEGIYDCYIVIEHKDMEFGDRVLDMKKLISVHIELKDSDNTNWFENIGSIYVDSGLAGFFENKPDFTDDGWSEFLKKVPAGEFAWNTEEGFFSLSGFGDGEYVVQGKKNSDDKFTHLYIDFTSDSSYSDF